jgi:ParB-like chromosome segregation protein Spo0J
VVAHLAASADLEELIQSISASGYVDIEPLIVEGRGDHLVVLEGNRRLAALKVLRDSELAVASKIALPEIKPYTGLHWTRYRSTAS